VIPERERPACEGLVSSCGQGLVKSGFAGRL